MSLRRSIQDLSQSDFVKAVDIKSLRDRPLPTAPDGHYNYEGLPASQPPSSYNAMLSKLHNMLDKASNIEKTGLPKLDKKAALDFFLHQDAVNDREHFFNEFMANISKVPVDSVKNELNNVAVGTLYNTLTHPPATFLDKKFRSADGSNNSLLYPNLGKSGLPYARSVQTQHPLPLSSLPDPGLIFDVLLKAQKGNFLPHPNGNSGLTFAWASIVTHSLFRTDTSDWTKNNTTSYLDLSPLYGFNEATQMSVRDTKKGRGLLFPDTFQEDRLVLLPPAASALLVIFSRNHNYIADMLLKINERGTWTDPSRLDEEGRKKQDEEIFQTARLINCGHYMSIIMNDYLAGFLGLPRDGNAWAMDAFDPIKTVTGEVIPRGEGNHVSVEFNLLYRWHAVLSEKDIQWTNEKFSEWFNKKPFEQITLDDFKNTAKNIFRKVSQDPAKRTFGGLQRQDDGTFKDEDLAKVLQDATDDAAGAYRARGIPEALRIIEIMTINQARVWGCCTLNEFRKFLGLKQFTKFSEWNPNPDVAAAAEQLYGHVDNLELYPGLMAEETMPLGPGSGICCGYTMTRAVLGDAIALVRGDRYYTTDFTPGNLTAWGYQDCARNAENGAFGASLPRLLMRHLPRFYPANSVYSLFPFFTPQQSKKNLTKLDLWKKYTFERPKEVPKTKVVKTVQAIDYVFSNPQKYKTTYNPYMNNMTEGYGFMLTFDEKAKHDKDRHMAVRALFPKGTESLRYYAGWYKQVTTDLIKEYSYQYNGVPGNTKYVDIVKNVINLVGVHWAAEKLCGVPLKTKRNPEGALTEQECADIFALLFSYVFQNTQPEHGWTLHEAAVPASALLNGFIEASLIDVAPHLADVEVLLLGGKFKVPLSGSIRKRFQSRIIPAVKACEPFLKRLTESNPERPIRDFVANIASLAVGSSANYSQAVTQIVDFYLDDKYKKEREEIIRLSKLDDPESNELLSGYIREAMRLNPQFPGLYRSAAEDDVIEQGNGLPPIKVNAGDVIFGSYYNAQMNPEDFSNPEVVDPRRDKTKYRLQGSGMHQCIALEFVQYTFPPIIKTIFSLPNIRRAPGAKGVLAGFNVIQEETKTKLYIDSTGNWGPWPGSMTIAYDS